jgi:uncharacterized membrane protein
MYKIIGADQKEYGPVSAEQIRQWIAEGRANDQTMIQAEGATEWKPLSAFPEFASALSFAPAPPLSLPPPGALPGVPTPEELLARDYELDMGSCITRAWELLKQHFWPMVGVAFLLTMIMGAVQQLLSLLSQSSVHEMIVDHKVNPVSVLILALTSLLAAPVNYVATAGLLNYYLRLIRKQPATMGDAFAGFTTEFVPLVLLGLVSSLLALVGYALCVLPGIYLAVAWWFALPLVIDRHLGFWDAMEISRKVVNKHWFYVFAFVLVIGLLGVAGIVACCVGIFVTMPIFWAAWMYAYEDIFGPRSAPAP